VGDIDLSGIKEVKNTNDDFFGSHRIGGNGNGNGYH